MDHVSDSELSDSTSDRDGDEEDAEKATNSLEIAEGFIEFCPRILRLLPMDDRLVDDGDEMDVVENSLSSAICFIRGLPFCLIVSRYIDGNQQPHLNILTECNAVTDSNFWECSAEFELSVCPQGAAPGAITPTKNSAFTFSKEKLRGGENEFLSWNIVSDPANGYFKEDCIKIQAKIKAAMPKGGVWDSYNTIFPYMGFKNTILNLQRVDEQRRVRGPAAAQIKQAFRFKTDLVGRNTCGINFRPLNNMKLEITHKLGSRIVYVSLLNLGKGPASQGPRFIDAEISFLRCENGRKQSHGFKLSGRIKKNTNYFKAQLCSLKDLAPFFHVDGLSINLSLKISEGKRTQNVQPLVKEFVKFKRNSFGASLLGNSNFSDFNLECDGEKILCHKAVLAAGSPVFATMFQSGMVEAVQNSMKIEDMTLPGLKVFLKLIYGSASTNEIIGVPVAFDLWKAGEKYQIPDIRELGSEILQNKPENKFPIEMIFELFAFSKQMKITKLMDRAVNIFKTRGKEYVKTEEFSEILKDHTKFAQEIISRSLEVQ